MSTTPLFLSTNISITTTNLEQTHAYMLKTGQTLHQYPASRLIHAAATSPSTLAYAYSIFKHTQNPNTYMYNTLIRAYANSITPLTSLSLLACLMSGESEAYPDKYTWTFAIKACSCLFSCSSSSPSCLVTPFFLSFLIKKNSWVFSMLAFLAFKMLAFGLKNHIHAAARSPITLAYAHSIFTHTQNPNTYMYNNLIRVYANSTTPQTSLSLLARLMSGENEAYPDKYTWTFALKACSYSSLSLGACLVSEGRQVHGCVVKNGYASDEYVCNTLIHMYARFGEFEVAWFLLDGMPGRGVISYNVILSAYVDKGMVELAREMFDEMPERNTESCNFMISGYVGAGLVKEARGVFDEMVSRNVVSWNAMITGCVSTNCFEEALDLFEEMQSRKVDPDECTFVNVLSACARVGALSQGKWVHAYIEKNQISISNFLATALVDMYSKCGCIDKALEVFRLTLDKDISTWNSMISGLGSHGDGKQALVVFSEMLAKGLIPNEVTFVGVLSACSRAGLLEEGQENFEIMSSVYNIEPKVQHYGCMVDLLGRFGLLQEAEELIKKLPMEEAPVMWESLLGACRSHCNTKMAEQISKYLLELSPRETSGYVQLSNVHASMGRWKEATEVRREMRGDGMRKVPGCSIIEVDGVVHEFLAGEGMVADI